jgi:hypothetical protein
MKPKREEREKRKEGSIGALQKMTQVGSKEK